MAVGVIIECKWRHTGSIRPVLAKMGRTPEGAAPRGACFIGTAAEDGIRVTDVWKTREELEAFAAEQIGLLSVDLGFPAPPEITFHDVYNCDSAYGRLDAELV
jgi:hypothetical protein